MPYQNRFSQDFDSGVELFLKAQGLKNVKEMQAWKDKLYQSQLTTEALQQKHLGQQTQMGELKYKELVEGLQKQKDFETAIQGALGQKKISIPEGEFVEKDVSPPGQEIPWMVNRMAPVMAQYDPKDFWNKAITLMPKPDTDLTEPKILALGPSHPFYQNYINAKKELQKNGGVTRTDILSRPDDDPSKINLMKAEKELGEKQPYFQAVGIIEATNELIGFDTRTFQTKRVPIPGMPIKPGTVKSVNPIQQAIADSLKEIGKYKIEGQGEMPLASANKGKFLTDTTTGERYQSDGTNWIPVRAK